MSSGESKTTSIDQTIIETLEHVGNTIIKHYDAFQAARGMAKGDFVPMENYIKQHIEPQEITLEIRAKAREICEELESGNITSKEAIEIGNSAFSKPLKDAVCSL